ncbi:unnamed protein product [Gongylonema pulchrum]|uniref:DUF1115 domain-containing protein n=1 Tax=Gongylonema pulchrum TaxID=637853 RepID=A0A183DA48_9BILA|nr:unnamed protein product [Gongylonema pulchrum]
MLKTRAKKYAVDRKILSVLDSLSSEKSGCRVGLLINERLLHFPSAIAAPAFSSLRQDYKIFNILPAFYGFLVILKCLSLICREDLKKSGSQYRFSHVILFLKIRIADSNNQEASGTAGIKGKKKLSKAQKRRIAASAIADAEVVFDNPEEELLFQGAVDFEHFQYPVQSDVEKDSKFNSLVLKGVTYRPYRRVCILESDQFQHYIDLVSTAEGL